MKNRNNQKGIVLFPVILLVLFITGVTVIAGDGYNRAEQGKHTEARR